VIFPAQLIATQNAAHLPNYTTPGRRTPETFPPEEQLTDSLKLAKFHEQNKMNEEELT